MITRAHLDLLAERRMDVWRYLGTPSDGNVISRLVPGRVAWPASTIGRMIVIRRPQSVLLVTDGLSDPYDPELHDKPPPGPLDFELCMSIDRNDPGVRDDRDLAESIWPQLLYALADVMVEEWYDVRGLLTQHTAITIRAVCGIDHPLVDENHISQYLLGMPLDGDDFGRQIHASGHYADLPVPYADAALCVVPVVALHPSELAWAVERGNTGALELAREFIAANRGCRNRSTWKPRH
jgi:hypothetical protein